MDAMKAEKEGTDNILRFTKAQYEDLEIKYREVINKGVVNQAKLESFESGANKQILLDRKKKECLTLEKDLILAREACDNKSREITSLMQKNEAYKFDGLQNQLG